MTAIQTQAGAELDPIWRRIREEAAVMIDAEPQIAGLAHSVVLRHARLEDALCFRLAEKLGGPSLGEMALQEIALEAFAGDPELGLSARADIVAVHDRDPACTRFIEPLLYFKGFSALVAHRVKHWLWLQGRRDLAMYLQMLCSERFGLDIHPGARLGRGIMIDHAHAIVIGETCVVGDDVSIMQGATLGGTGKEDGDRHPKVESGVLIGAGAKVLGNVRIGACSRIAAGSVVLKDVPPRTTVAGVPARAVGDAGCAHPSYSMNQLMEGGG